MAELARRGVMLVLASPSGAGKSSISRALFENDPHIALSVSVTTRARRTDEIEGRHYHFVDVPTFERMRAGGELLESAEVHGNFYGTPRAKVEERLSSGRDILFDIDYQGTLQLLEQCRPDMVTVFILPPSIRELKARLERRAQDSKGTIQRRLKNARIEMEHFSEYDYVLVNRDLEDSVQKVAAALAAARLARSRYRGLPAFVRGCRSRSIRSEEIGGHCGGYHQMITHGDRDPTLDVLLELDGQGFFVDAGRRFWVKFEVRRVKVDAEHPHGLRYSLTLHGPQGERLVGFDNAHRVSSGSGPGATQSRDHRHRLGHVRQYAYRDAARLLSDFWAEVESVLREKGVMK